MKWLSGICCFIISLFLTVHAQVLDIAHRGYASVNPESTLQAFMRAHEQGADGLEFDVRQTKDNILVVAHDAKLPTLSNLTISEVYFSDLFMRSDVPSLEEVLIFAKQVDQTVWLEIKQSHLYPNIIDHVIALIDQYDIGSKTVIQSFNHNDLMMINKERPNLRLLALYSTNFHFNNVPYFADYVGLPMLQNYLNASLISRLHEQNKQVIFWRTDSNSESKETLQQFINAGANGFMLDRSLKAIMQY